MTSATLTPVSASSTRPPGVMVGVAGMIITSSDWMVTWKPKRLLDSRKRASIPAPNTTTRICHAPEPITWRASSPRSTPSITPQPSSTTLRIFFSIPKPMMMKATIEEKNGNSCPHTNWLIR